MENQANILIVDDDRAQSRATARRQPDAGESLGGVLEATLPLKTAGR